MNLHRLAAFLGCALLPGQLSALLPDFAPLHRPETIIAEAPAPPPKTPIILTSWNIEWFPTRRPDIPLDDPRVEPRIQAIAAKINELDPTIMVAVEIRDAATLAKLNAGFSHIACTAIPRPPDENPDLPNQGIALMSKLPWKKIWALDFSGLPQTADRPSRGILAAEFSLPGQRPLYLYAVHLKSNRSGIGPAALRRQRAIDYWLADLRRLQLNPAKDFIIIMGDFNSSARDPRFREDKTIPMILQAGFILASEGSPVEKTVTIPGDGRYPPNDFDHIFLSKALADVMPGPPPWMTIHPVEPALSDHYPIRLVLPFQLNPDALPVTDEIGTPAGS